MPNNVYNRLIIKGESNKLEQFYIKNRIEENIDTKEKKELLCFSNLVPIINQDNWYEERIQKWSTKWEPYDITINENYDNNNLKELINDWFENLYKIRKMNIYKKGTKIQISGRSWWI